MSVMVADGIVDSQKYESQPGLDVSSTPRGWLVLQSVEWNRSPYGPLYSSSPLYLPFRFTAETGDTTEKINGPFIGHPVAGVKASGTLPSRT
jgi:hypothetical protein